MKTNWIVREGNKKLVILFAGWSSGPLLYEDIKPEGCDVLLCHSFDDYEFDFSLTAGYDSIYLYAWSLGVHAAERALHSVNLAAAFAINGTGCPCDDEFGIPRKVFSATREGLNPLTLKKFRRRMFVSRDEAEAVMARLEDFDIDSLKHELAVVERAEEASVPMKWTRAYVGSQDRIMPPASQRKFWEGRHVDIVETEAPHYMDLNEIVGATLIDYRRLGDKFRKSASTYETYATPQRRVALVLAEMLCHRQWKEGMRMLEIGQGTGIFTRLCADIVRPESIDFIDLYETPRMGVASEECYYTGDVGEWIKTADKIWDLVVSSSALQWVAPLRQFVGRASEHITPEGVMACALFTAGTLSELDSLRPSPIAYHTAGEVRDILNGYFGDVEFREIEMRQTFGSAREALIHLRRTGTDVSAGPAVPLGELLRAVPRQSDGKYYLTYRAAAFIAEKPL